MNIISVIPVRQTPSNIPRFQNTVNLQSNRQSNFLHHMYDINNVNLIRNCGCLSCFSHFFSPAGNTPQSGANNPNMKEHFVRGESKILAHYLEQNAHLDYFLENLINLLPVVSNLYIIYPVMVDSNHCNSSNDNMSSSITA